MTKVLILGVRGQTGRELAAQLQARGVEVRGTARDASAIDVPGVEPAAFDWEKPETWAGAVDGGFDGVWVVRPEIEDAGARIASFLEQHGDAVGRVVLLSEISAETLPKDDWVATVETAVVEGTDRWTLVRPASFFQLLNDERYLLAAIRDEGTIIFPTADGRNAMVDVRDIAAVAAEALLDDAHAQKAYTVSGPEALTFAEVAERLTKAVGHEVRHGDPSLEEAVESFRAAGLEEWFVQYLRGASERVRDGRYGKASDDIEQVTGKPPRTLDAFLEEHADLLRR